MGNSASQILIDAVKEGDMEKTRAFLSEHKGAIDKATLAKHQATLYGGTYCDLCQCKHQGICGVLVNGKYDVFDDKIEDGPSSPIDFQDKDGHTALMWYVSLRTRRRNVAERGS
jgi:hypothetical protein